MANERIQIKDLPILSGGCDDNDLLVLQANSTGTTKAITKKDLLSDVISNDKLINEISRATNAENTITTNLSSEITRAKKAETDLNSIINTNKPVWDDKYTRNEIDNKISKVITDLDWKESVATYSDLATTYPNAQDGWTVNVKDTDITYRSDGINWITISANSIPLATSTVSGKMSSSDKSFLDSVRTAWTNITTHIADTVKHITSSERTLWNTVSNKAEKSHTHTKNQITDIPTKLSQFTNDSGFITSADVDTSQNHTHINKAVLDGITSDKITSWDNKIDSSKITKINSNRGINWDSIPYIGHDGAIELGKYIDFHTSNNGTTDYDIRIEATTDTLKCNKPITASLIGNADTATKAIKDSDGKQINTTYVKKGTTWNELEGV